MSVSHSPGPWQVEFKSFGKGVIQAGEVRDVNNNVVTHIGITCESDIADARLIAAAPGLLAACREVAEFLGPFAYEHGGGYEEVLDTLKAAIARADPYA